MITYTDMSAAELVDQLINEAEKVGTGLIGALVERGEEAAELLRVQLSDEENWYEGSYGKYWIVQHALAVLSLMKDQKSLPLILEMLPHAYFADHEPAIDFYAAAIANFGAPAIPDCEEFIRKFRGAFQDNPDFSYCRYKVLLAMTLIARADESVRRRVTDFVIDLYEDENEDDETFLSFSAPCPLALDPQRGLKAVEKAYQRGVMDDTINGTFDQLSHHWKAAPRKFLSDLDSPLNKIEHFYSPKAIDAKVRSMKEPEDEKLYWGVPDLDLPTGFQFTEAGPLVNPVKIGRNDPCHCGSGKKYKKCCGAND